MPARARRAVAVISALLGACGGPDAPSDPAARSHMRLAVIGNSDSHAFQDSVNFVPGSRERGGPQRAVTFQWTEILARLRGDAVDQGMWGVRGAHPRVARAAALVGVTIRSPRKQDFAFNVAYSGARCAHLDGPRGQVAQLVHEIARDSAGWEDGIVLVRIGINDLGRRDVLERLSRDGASEDVRAELRAAARACARTIVAAVPVLRAAQPSLRVALVGLLDNANWPPNFDLFRDSASVAAQREVLDAFDDALRAFAGATPGVAFIDDRAAFDARWGTRGPAGEMDYRATEIGGLRVTLAQGDGLEHAAIADGHAGTVFNALWAQALVAALDAQLDARIPPITDAELDAFVRSLAGR